MRFVEKTSKKPPCCPFCGKIIKRPEILPIGISDLEAGICECGSVYVCDVTGHNRGTAFLEALFIATAGDWDLMWDLEPEIDYKEIWIENYDYTHHLVFPFSQEKPSLKSALCFVKLSEDLREIKLENLKKHLEKKEITRSFPFQKRKLDKKEVETFISNGDFSTLSSYVVSEPLNLSVVQKFLYHPDPIFRKKVIVALGQIGRDLSKFYPEKVLEFIKRLLYSAADSASSAWGALEAVGDIIRETGERYSIFVKNLLAFLNFPEYRPYVLYALYRISEKNPQALKKHSYLKLLDYFNTGDNQTKGLILSILLNLKTKEIGFYLKNINPEESFEIFDYDKFCYQKVFFREIIEKFERS